MNITLESTDKVNGVLTAVVAPEDYKENVATAVKDFRKNASMHGFRKGAVPEGLIRKLYGKEIVAEVVNKMLQEDLYKYISENKVNMLGEPMPLEGNEKATFVDGDTFTFKFDIAIAPEFKVEATSKDKLPYYNVKISDDMVDKQVEMYRQRGGSYDKVDSYQDNDMVKGTITEVGEDGKPVEGGLIVEDVVMIPKYLDDENTKILFEGAAPESEVVFNLDKAYNGKDSSIASLLKIDKEEVANHKGDVCLKISEITRFVPGPLDKNLFDSVYPDGSVNTPEEFKEKIRSAIQNQFDKDSDYKFILDARKYFDEKVGDLQWPDEKLKKFLKAKSDKPETVEDSYDANIRQLKWHLIKEQLVEQTGIKIADEDVKNMARETTRMQFAQYGMLDIPEEYIESSVNEMLKKRETVDNLIDRCIEMKLSDALKNVVKLDKKEVTAEEFNKMFE